MNTNKEVEELKVGDRIIYTDSIGGKVRLHKATIIEETENSWRFKNDNFPVDAEYTTMKKKGGRCNNRIIKI